MARLDKTWMDIHDRCDSRYIDGVEYFLEFAFHDDRTIFRYGENKELIQCPCKKCFNTVKLTREEVKTHLIISGVWGHYRVWMSHGEEVVDIDQQMEEDNAEQFDQTEVQDNVVDEPIMDMLHDLQRGNIEDVDNEQEPNEEAK